MHSETKMSSLADLLLPQPSALDALPPSIADLLETLSQAAAALHLADTRPASLAAAARQAASAAQEAQDREVRMRDTKCTMH
jgi:hypothetical protein